MRPCLLVQFPLSLLVVLAVPPLAAQDASVIRTSYSKARAALDRALTAHGGLERLRSIERIALRHEGVNHNRNQSRRVAPPYDETPASGFLARDYRGGRLVFEQASQYPGGFDNASRLVIVPGEAWQANLVERRWFRVQNPQPAELNILRRLPQTHLLAALDRAATLRWLGEARWRGRKQAVITYAAQDGQQITLFLDGTNGTLSGIEQLFSDPLTGDAAAQISFDGYQPVEGIQMPGRRSITRAGELVEDVRFLGITINAPFPDSLLLRSTDLVDGNATTPPDTGLTRLGDGVYLLTGIAGGNNALAVEFREFLVVIEAYGSDADSRRALARLRAAVPGKPIRYLVPTHHHDDHTGGLRTYIAEDVTILTTAGNRGYLEAMATGRWTLQRDLQAERNRPLRIETISGKRHVIRDDTQVLELLDMGPSPHADEMLVAWLPNARVLFQGDLLNRPADGRLRPANRTTRHFAAWLAQSGLPVERIAGVHGPVSTRADLDQSLALAGAQ